MIGPGGFGAHTLAALRQCPAVTVVGLADRDSAAATRLGRQTGLPFFTDNRALLAQTRPRAVFAAVPPQASAEIVHLCAERGISLWKELPLARNLTEAAALVRRMESAGAKFAVGTQRRFAAGYRRAWQLRGCLGQVFLARAHYLFNWGGELRWRADRAGAGGAMMELGYHAVDLLTWLLGLPEEVYGMAADVRLEPLPGERLAPVHDSDDTAAALLRYSRGLMASLVTTRRSGPVSEHISLHGRAGSLVAEAGGCTLRDPDGKLLDSVAEEPSPLAVFSRQVAAFAAAAAGGGAIYECSARENLLNMAVIDAIYLSSRTRQPETPLRLLQQHDLTAADCLVNSPPPADCPLPRP
jgi:predicted dehydrogenase